jgi:uncharacterized protein YfaS (alpha-2-macroglobulin family)
MKLKTLIQDKRKKYLLLGGVVLLVGLLVFGGIKLFGKKEMNRYIDPGFSEYIMAIPQGIISSTSSLKIVLVKPYARFDSTKTDAGKLFSISPSVEGKAHWIDARTVEFVPAKKLKSGETYTVTFKLGEILDVPDKFKELVFDVRVIRQRFRLIADELQSNTDNLAQYSFKAKLRSTDVLSNDEAEKIVQAEFGGQKIGINWQHGANAREHVFVIEGITRTNASQNLNLKCDGSNIGIDEKYELNQEIPAAGDFKVMDANALQTQEQCVKIQFSDPLNPDQDLRGLIVLGNCSDFKLSVKGNLLFAYPQTPMEGANNLTVNEGVLNTQGKKLPAAFSKSIVFSDQKPAVEFIGEGTIMPSSENLNLPFKAVNLRAVDVTVIKIFEENIPQFLQVNQLSGMSEIQRVGRPLCKQTIDLSAENLGDLGTWNTYSLDLSKMIQVDPGAIYRIKLSFKQSYSMYPCGSESAVDDEDMNDEFSSPVWDEGYDYSYDEYEGGYYDDDYWENTNNPCHRAYYNSNRFPCKNILASDLGIIAKADKNNRIQVFVSDIRNTQAMSDVDIEVQNFQQQKIGEGKTDSEGFCAIDCKGKPYLLIAKSGRQRGFLRMDGGSALSLSSFDVGGEDVQKGLKGFIYGERGVWRPGDTLFLSFILEDKEKILPPGHPVIMELYNPKGQKYTKMVKTLGLNGFYCFAISTRADVPTGNWQAKVVVGGATFTKRVKIETIKPNRLKINLIFDKPYISGVSGLAKLKASWLHGAVARNLKAVVDVTLTKSTTSFSNYADYAFDDPANDFYSEAQTIFSDKTDNEGNASIPLKLNTEKAAPGMLKAHFLTKVFEEGGDFSIDHTVIDYAPYDCFIGVKTPKATGSLNVLLTDENHNIQVVTVNPMGKPVSRKNLTATVYKLDWRWWWDASQDNLASFLSSTYHKPVYQTTLSTGADGKGAFNLKINYPEWGRYLVRVSDAKGHATGKIVYIDWPGWGSRSRDAASGGATMLVVSTDKEKYKTGETATLNIPATANGRALVTVEKGSRILAHYWVETSNKAQQFSIKITPDMAPNVFFGVMVIQPHQKNNDLPLRLYGYTPVMVENPETQLTPVLSLPDNIESEQKVDIKVKEAHGKAMTYTIAVVDEGLLDLTHFDTPNPWPSFYAREALGVGTWDVYNDVLGAYGARLEQVFAIGGDEDLKSKGANSASRFTPVVKFLGPFTLKAGKTATHSFVMPKYVGAVRTMIIAGQDGAYGMAEKSSKVTKPLMLLASLPRVLGLGEKFKLPVTVFASDASIKQVNVKVSANNLFGKQAVTSRSLTFNSMGEQLLDFDLSTLQTEGVGKIKIEASSGKYKADYEIEINVRNPNPYVNEVHTQLVKAGQKWSGKFNLPGSAGTNSAQLEVSTTPPINLSMRLEYLLSYPYGCVEQTTSSAFPQLFVADVSDLNEQQLAHIQINVNAAIQRLASFQLANGGLSYWQGGTVADEWGTSYAGQFMFEAEKKGYSLPSGFKSAWLNYQTSTAQNWSGNGRERSDFVQAYRLYTLALAGHAEFGSMNRLKERKDLSVQARWSLAAAYAIAGQKNTAKEICFNISTAIAPYRELDYSYGSDLRDKALIIETLQLINQPEKAMPLIEEISAALSSDSWMSTQSTAYCLLAVTRFSPKAKGLPIFSYVVDNSKDITVRAQKSVSQQKLNVGQGKAISLNFSNNGKDPLYVRLALKGKPAMQKAEAGSNVLSLSVDYFDSKHNALNIKSIAQGQEVLVKVKVSNNGSAGNLKNIALSVPVPSGWEIENTRVHDYVSAASADVPDYLDIRDDKALYFFNLDQNKSKTFTLQCIASYSGNFYLPVIQCETMYDNRNYARIAGQWVSVSKK